MNDSLIDLLILAALGAGSLLQWWLKRQRAARAAQPTPAAPPVNDARPRQKTMSIEDALAELFGGTPQPRPVMDWQPISVPDGAPPADVPAPEQEDVPQRLVANVPVVASDDSAAPATPAALARMLSSRDDLRRAFIIKELLDPPVSLR
jgi:hypothetical protein